MSAVPVVSQNPECGPMPTGVALEDVGCPLGCPDSREKVLDSFDRLNGIGGKYTIYRCLKCGLMRTTPRPTASTIGVYYPDNYSPYQQSAVTSKKRISPFKQVLKRMLGRDIRRLPMVSPGHLLEIGCASGNYLLEMQSQGWSTEGVEFSPTAANNARRSGLRVQTGSIEEADPPHKSPDLIVAWMVLEHLHEPVKALTKLRGWIKDDGYLIGVVPDASSWELKLFGHSWYALHMPAHLFHYTPKTLGKILSASGWELTHIRWQASCVNLLNTLEFWCLDTKRERLLRVIQWFKNSRKMKAPRKLLAWLLGLLHLSGGMEFWATKSPGGA